MGDARQTTTAPGEGVETATAAAAHTPQEPPAGRHTKPPVAARYGLLFVTVGLIVLFSVLKPDTYLTTDNFLSIAESQAITGLLALAIICVLIVGEFDLSFAAIFGLTQVLAIGLMVKQGLPLGVDVLAVLVIGIVAGLVNSLLTVRLAISSFIATLGVSTILNGLSVGYSNGEVVSGKLPALFTDLGQKSVGGVALPVLYVVVVAAVLFVVLQYSATGRHMVAAGGNRDAARLAGISVGRAVMAAFVIAGLFSAIAAIVSASQLGSGQPLLSNSYLLPAYAGAFLGATAITPGRFNVWGTLIGVYLLGAGVTGLQQLGLATWVQDAFNGAVLLGAVAVSGFLTRRPGRRAGSAQRARTTAG
jgi:ribose transport system permease protein